MSNENNACVSAEQDAANEFAKDVDLDIPITDQQKEAVRWLLSEAFKAGHEWEQKRKNAEVSKMMTDIKGTAQFWLDNQ